MDNKRLKDVYLTNVYEIFFVGTLIVLTSLIGCKKISAGITTTISGTVMDDNRSIPIPNAKLKITEDKYNFAGEAAGESPIGDAGTAVTGPDGKYSITFTTNGKGDEYLLGMSLDTNYLNWNNQRKVTVGHDSVMNFTAWRLATLKAHIIVKNNPAPPLRVTGLNLSGSKIFGINNDTVINLLVVPNKPNSLGFEIQIPGNFYSSYFNPSYTFPGFSDIYYESITVYPSTFVQL